MKHLRVVFCVLCVIALLLPPATGFAQGSRNDLVQTEPDATPLPPNRNFTPDPNPPLPPAAPIQLLAPAAVRTPPSVSPLGREVTLTVGAADTFALTVNTGDPRLRKTDIMFTFDLTGSMSDEIAQAKASALTMAQNIRDLLPNSRFGVASFMDYPGAYNYTGYAATYGTAPDVPWRLDQSPTADMDVFTAVVNGLTLGNGEDSPEDYTRVLFELGQINNIGWRKNAKKIVILFGDDATHDLDFAGFNFGGDPGPNAVAEENVPGGDDLDFETVVASLKNEHIAVIGIDSGGTTQSEATFKGMSIGLAGASGTAGKYFLLTNTAGLPQAVVNLVDAEAQVIDTLSLQASAGFGNWVTPSPLSMVDVPAESAQVFNVTISPPGGTTPGLYAIGIQAVADDVILGVTTVFVSVLSATTTPVNDLCFTPNQTTPPCFLPNPNGFNLPVPLPASVLPDWAMFRQLFGSAQVEYANGTPILAAQQYFNTTYHVNTEIRFALAGLSLINFRQLQQPNSGGFALPVTANLFGATSTIGGLNTITKTIGYAAGTRHNYENSASASFFCASYTTPAQWYEFIRSKLQNGDPTVVTLSYMEGGVKKQISLAPFKVIPAQAFVSVYEPFSVGDKDYRLEFNLAQNEVRLVDTSPTPPGSGQVKIAWTQIQAVADCKLFVTPLNIFLHQGVPPWKVVPVNAAAVSAADVGPATVGAVAAVDDGVQIYSVRGDATLLVEDDSGRRFGWNGETFQNDIPGAVFLGQAGTGSFGPGDTLLPGGFQYKVWLIGLNTGQATLMTWVNNAFVQVADVAVTPGSRTEIDVALDGSTVTLIGANAPTTATITINQLLNGEDRTVTANNIPVQTGQTVQMTYTVGTAPDNSFAAAAAGDEFRLTSTGGPSTAYNLSLQRRGDAGYTAFGAPAIALDANSTQSTAIYDWTNLGGVALAVDEGRDGTVDNFINAPNAAAPASIEVSAAPASVIVGGETEVTVAVYDQFGAPAPDGTPVELSTTLGVLDPATGITVGGLVKVKLQSGTQAGPAVVTAATGSVTGTGTIAFAPAVAASLSAAAAPASVPADGASTTKVTVRLVDAFNNPVAGARVSFQTSLGSINATASTGADGRAAATLTAALKVGTAIVTATSESLVQTATVPFVGGAIRGTVFADLNRNGVLDKGEPPMRGVWILAVGTKADVRGATRSAATGVYQVAALPITSYTVTAAASPGLRYTTRRSFDVNLGLEGVDMPAIGGVWTLYLPQVKRQ